MSLALLPTSLPKSLPPYKSLPRPLEGSRFRVGFEIYVLGFRAWVLPNNVGPALVYRSPIICFGGWRIQDLGSDSRSPKMCFDFGGLTIQEEFSTIPFKSIYRDLRTVGAHGGRIEGILISIFRRALMLGGGPTY